MKNSTLRGVPSRERLAFTKELITRKGVLRTDDGIEVSIPNIIVAVSVSIAVIIAVVVGVVWIVPWTQDNNAKSQVASIQSAQQLYYAQNSTYGTKSNLLTSTSSSKQVLVDSGAGNFDTTGDKNYYCIVVKSDTGVVFWADSTSTQVNTTKPSACSLSVP